MTTEEIVSMFREMVDVEKDRIFANNMATLKRRTVRNAVHDLAHKEMHAEEQAHEEAARDILKFPD